MAAQSPDGTTVVTAAADETLRFWKILSGGSLGDEVRPQGPRWFLSVLTGNTHLNFRARSLVVVVVVVVVVVYG